ncbi:MAG: hypothetical protein ACRDJM_05970, partial [Actinomycetota bacterium]
YASYGYAGGMELADINCGEDGLQLLDGSPAEGVVSRIVHDTGEPAVDSVDPGLGLKALVHQVNCDVVVPIEDLIDATL